MALTLTTRIEAVNIVLRALGLPPVNSLSGDVTADVATAEAIIDEVSKEIQTPGWNFNTEQNYTLTPDVDGYINVPTNMIKCDLMKDQCYSEDVTLRGQSLYDRYNHTYVFTGSSYLAEVTFLLDWDLLPEPARKLIAMLSANKATEGLVGDPTMAEYTEEDVARARIQLENHDATEEDGNLLDNYDVARILYRDGVAY